MLLLFRAPDHTLSELFESFSFKTSTLLRRSTTDENENQRELAVASKSMSASSIREVVSSSMSRWSCRELL